MSTGYIRARLLAASVLCAFMFSGCGGGGGGDTTPPSTLPSNPPPSNSPAPQVSAEHTSASAQAQVGGATPTPLSIAVTVVNPPTTALSYTVATSGSAIVSATFAWQTPAQGQLVVAIPDPAQLGAGTFPGTVTLNVCTDAACSQPVSGSPIVFTISYTVIASASGTTPTFSVQQPQYRFVAHTLDPAPTLDVLVTIHDVPAAGLYIQPSQPAGGFITGLTSTQSDESNGDIIVTMTLSLEKPISIGSGYFSSSITYKVCYDQACTRQLNGSPANEPIDYTVYLTNGHEYSGKKYGDGGTSGLVYDPISAKLYLSALAGYSNAYTGTVSQIDPLTATLGIQAPLSEDLAIMATSDDGAYLYVASKNTAIVHRLTLPTLLPDLNIPISDGVTPNPNGAIPLAGQMAVAPGAAHTLAVAYENPGSDASISTLIFDDTAARPQKITMLGRFAYPDSIMWGASADTLYMIRSSYQLPLEQDFVTATVSTGGLTVGSALAFDLSTDVFGRSFYSNGRLYDLEGQVFDAITGTSLGQFPLPFDLAEVVTLVPDPARHRVFYLARDGITDTLVLLNFDSTTFALQSLIDFPYDTPNNNETTNLILWGSAGVAFNRNGVHIMSGSFYRQPSAQSAGAQAHKTQRPRWAAPWVHIKAAVTP